jgi:hypothetical protein
VVGISEADGPAFLDQSIQEQESQGPKLGFSSAFGLKMQYFGCGLEEEPQ